MSCFAYFLKILIYLKFQSVVLNIFVEVKIAKNNLIVRDKQIVWYFCKKEEDLATIEIAFNPLGTLKLLLDLNSKYFGKISPF